MAFNDKPYRDYSDFLRERFGIKMQKLSVNVGRSCPNRDGTIGRGGCTYCNNQAFTPAYCLAGDGVGEQLAKGREFFGRKYPEMHYMAYFQSYTSTYGNLSAFKAMCEEALAVPGIEGLIVATRPDCIDAPTMAYLGSVARRGKYVMIELGAESAHDSTLRRVNRCHRWADTVMAVRLAQREGIPVGLHLIMGLPGESEAMMLETVRAVSLLGVDTVKFHQLQVVEGTLLAASIAAGRESVEAWTIDDYIDFCCQAVGWMSPSVAIERFTAQSPGDMLISPRWGLKNHEFVHRLVKRLREKGITQGCLREDR